MEDVFDVMHRWLKSATDEQLDNLKKDCDCSTAEFALAIACAFNPNATAEQASEQYGVSLASAKYVQCAQVACFLTVFSDEEPNK